MKPSLLAFLVLIAALPAAHAAAPVGVFVSVLPLRTIVEKVGDGHVRVQAMVQPGQSPHSFEPTPRQVQALAGAALYVRTGMPFEDIWMARFRGANPRMRVLDARAGIQLRRQADEDGRTRTDPHIWTSPLLAKAIARNVRDALDSLDPTHRRDYERNCQAFVAQLSSLDREIRVILRGVRSRSFMVFHPAWGYFAETYGLTQVAVQQEGKEPGAKSLSALIDQARREEMKVIFVQPELSARAAKQLARAIGGRVETADPLAPDYVDNLRRFARLIAEAARS
jgi:zinc transport system substrate-binding protein